MGYPIRTGFLGGIASLSERRGPAGPIGMQRTAPNRAMGAGEAKGFDRLPTVGGTLVLLPIVRLGARHFSSAHSTMRSAARFAEAGGLFRDCHQRALPCAGGVPDCQRVFLVETPFGNTLPSFIFRRFRKWLGGPVV